MLTTYSRKAFVDAAGALALCHDFTCGLLCNPCVHQCVFAAAQLRWHHCAPTSKPQPMFHFPCSTRRNT